MERPEHNPAEDISPQDALPQENEAAPDLDSLDPPDDVDPIEDIDDEELRGEP